MIPTGDIPSAISAHSPQVIPTALRGFPHWVEWRREERRNRAGEIEWTKVPYDCRKMSRRASTVDPGTWSTFDQVVAAVPEPDPEHGMGFAFHPSAGIVGIDLDACVTYDDNGRLLIAPWARKILERLNTYTELSPSRAGLHLYLYGAMPGGKGRSRRCEGGKVEAYDRARFFTVTGWHLEGTPLTVEHRDAELKALVEELWPAEPPPTLFPPNAVTLDDYDIIEKCRRARNGELFRRLYDLGDLSEYGDDHSAADLACCNLLAFYTQDEAQIDRLMRGSALYRPKWDERRPEGTYGLRTIGVALASQSMTYDATLAGHLPSGSARRRVPLVNPSTPTDGGASHNGSPRLPAVGKEQAPLASEAPWPGPPKPDAYYGVAGEFVERVSPHSEADPAALLVQFHIAVGCMLGRGPTFYVEDTIHRLNDFAVLVGRSAIARKGTALGRVKALIRRVDEEWATNHLTSGLSSGEGLIKWVSDRGPEEMGDKRLLVIEEELSSTLRVLQREGNTLSAQIRQAWDSGDLRVMTKNPLRASDTHIGMLGHITAIELRRELTATDAGNGFGNRFLWVAVKRSKLLPDGGSLDPAVLNSIVTALHEARTFAQKPIVLRRDEEAREIWHSVYGELSSDRCGLFGALTSRAEAHVLRWSMRNAVLDCSSVIRAEHLQAALAAWDYCERSAAFIFGGSLGDPIADQILGYLRAAPAGRTRTELYHLFDRNVRSERIGGALELLHQAGKARMEQRKPNGGGRPEERWFAL
jgi:hypothetical protein